MPKLEKDEDKAVQDWCKDHVVLWIKFTPMGEVGWPDRIAVTPNGTNLWIELKRNGKKPKPIQFYRMGLLAANQANVAWFDNAHDCIEYIKEFL